MVWGLVKDPERGSNTERDPPQLGGPSVKGVQTARSPLKSTPTSEPSQTCGQNTAELRNRQAKMLRRYCGRTAELLQRHCKNAARVTQERCEGDAERAVAP